MELLALTLVALIWIKQYRIKIDEWYGFEYCG